MKTKSISDREAIRVLRALPKVLKALAKTYQGDARPVVKLACDHAIRAIKRTSAISVVVLSVLLSGCGEPDCISRGGMRLHGKYWTCDEFQLAEDLTMDAFRRHSKDTRLHSTLQLQGYDVVMRDEVAFNSWFSEVTGVTSCPTLVMEVGRSSPLWVLPHEMAHALQRCTARGPDRDNYDDAHANWESDGIMDAVWELDKGAQEMRSTVWTLGKESR